MTMKDIFDAVSHIITSVATILAGAWAYYRFVKWHVFKPRLTLITTGRRLHPNNGLCSSILELSNVELSRVDIDSAILRICTLSGKPMAKEMILPRGDHKTTRRRLLRTSRHSRKLP